MKNGSEDNRKEMNYSYKLPTDKNKLISRRSASD